MDRIRRAFYRSLPKSMRYSVESLEPRYLLSGAPIPGPINLTDHTQTGNSHGSTSVTVNQYDGAQVANQLTAVIGKLSYLGQQIDKTSISNPVTSQVIPLLNQTIDQITQGSTGFTLGDMLFANTGVATTVENDITSAFTTATANGSSTNLSSAQLATDLQGVLLGVFGSGFTVTDNSTTGPTTGQQELDLTFAYTFNSPAITTPINLGNAAQQFNLAFDQVTSGGPAATAKMFTETTVSFDLKADFSTPADTGDTTSVSADLASYQSGSISGATLTSDLNNDFTFNPNNVEQTALISEEGAGNAGGYLPAFGVQFGVMGAGENDANGHVDGAYANNATFDLDVDAQLQFGASSYSLATLTSAESAATASNPYIPYTMETPVGNAATIPAGDTGISGTHALTNEATLTLPISVYDDGQSGTGPTMANDPAFISGLGNLTGTFTIQDNSLFNASSFTAGATLPGESTPLINANSVELASFARLTAASIVSMAQNSAYLAGEIDAQKLTADLPFLNLTQGQAYNFELALQNAFVNAMQSTQIVLTASNTPTTAGDPSDLTGATTFNLVLDTGTGASLKGYLVSVSLAADSTRTTMAGLVTALNAALNTALTAAGVSGTEVQAELITDSTGSQLLQLYSNDTTAQYFLENFAAPATGILDLGFNQYNNVIAQAPPTTTGSTDQLPGVIVQSGTAVNLANFNQPTTLDISVNGATAVPVTIAADAYNTDNGQTKLVNAVQQALITAGLWDGSSFTGVMVQSTTVGSGFGLEFYGGDDVHSLTVSDPGGSSNFSALDITPATSSATSFTLGVTTYGTTTTAATGSNASFNLTVASLTGVATGETVTGTGIAAGATITAINTTTKVVTLSLKNTAAVSGTVSVTGNSTASTPIYVNGNLTNGLLNEEQANQSATDLVSDLQRALIQAGVLNTAQTQGITVASSTNSSGASVFQFFAANPGSGVGQISSFSIDTSANGAALTPYFGSATLTSENISLATSVTAPNFETVQQLASTLYNLQLNGPGLNSDNYHGILASAPSYTAAALTSATGTPSFTFPIDITVNDASTLNGSTVLPDLTGVGFSFASAYDTVSALASASTISLARADSLSFDFGINLIAPSVATEELTATVPVSQLYTNYFLDSQGLIEFTPDNGVTYTVTIPANNAGDTTSLSTFLAALNTAIASATPSVSGAPALTTYLANSGTVASPSYVTTVTDPKTNGIDLVFTTIAGSTRELTLTVPTDSSTISLVNDAAWNDLGFLPNTSSTSAYTYNAATGGAITATYAIGAQANSTDSGSNAYVFSNSGFITFNFPDGSTGTLEIDPIDTSGNTTAANLVQTINSDILSTASLKGTSYLALQNGVDTSNYLTDVLQKVVASVNSSNQIVFTLNPDVYNTANTNPWSLTVQPQYAQENPNSLSTNIGLPGFTVADTVQPSVGLLSTLIPATLAVSGSDSFQVSIDGQNFTTVTVNLTGVNSMGGLVQAINNGISSASVTFKGITGSFPLSDYLTADATNGGTQVVIRLIDDGIVNNYNNGSTANNASAFPVLENAVLELTTATGPLATTLGFSSQQLYFTMQGSDGTIRSVSFSGTATQVDTTSDTGAAFAGTAAFGFTDFIVGQGLLNETAITNVTFAPSTTATINGLLVDSNADNFTSADFGGSIAVGVNNSSFAVLTLGQLGFPASTVGGLSFGSGATIQFGYGSYTNGANTYTGPAISSFLTLPTITPSEVIYTSTNNMQLLAGLDLASIVHGLERVGDMLSDWMQNGTGPFNTPLFFTLESLVNLDNFGQDFANAVAQVLVNAPTSLEATPAAVLQALQLDPSALTFNVVQTGSGSTAQVLLNISFDWAKTITETLPLAVDLASLANDVSTNSTYVNQQGQTEFYSSGVIKQWLLGLSTIASDPVNPININFSEVSQLAVNLDIISGQNGKAIQPEAVILNPSTGTFFQTNFLLDGDSLSGDLPAGTGYLQLTDGSFGIDASGLLDGTMPVLTVSNSNLTFYSGQNVITGTGAINGYTIGPSDVGSYVLINGQTTTAQNGLYEVTEYQNGTWQLTQDTAIVGIDPMARFYVEDGSSANLYYGLAATPPPGDAASNPFVSYVALAPVTGGTSNTTTVGTKVTTTLSGTGTLTIDSHAFTAADVGTYVQLSGQTTASQDGIYVVSAIVTGGSPTWTLTSATFNQFSQQAPLVYDAAAATSLSPTTLSVAYATAATITATATTVLTGTGTLAIGGTNLTAADVGQYVQLNAQAASDQNGTYIVTALSTAGGGSWTLTSVTGNPTISYTATAAITPGTATVTALSGNGTLRIDGHNFTSGNVGNLVLINDQTDPTQNGLYTVTTASGGTWKLTRSGVSVSGTRLLIQNGTVNKNLYFGYDTPTEFAQLLEPASFSYSLTGAETLPYTVQVATTSDLGAMTFTSGTILQPATLTGTPGVSLNSMTTTASDAGQTLHLTGIDNVQNLKVGSLILVKNQTNDIQNGVYVVTSLGGTDAKGNAISWVLARASFADTVGDLTGLRIDVAQGYENVGTRWIQSNASLSALDSTGNDITFSADITSIYSTGGTPWLTATALGSAAASLPLSIVVVTSNGTEVVIDNDLQKIGAGNVSEVTQTDLQNFYASLGQINGTTVTLDGLPVDSTYGLFYSNFTPFKPLNFNFNLATYFAAGGSNSVQFTSVPDLYDSYVSPSLITAFQNAFYVGDALDLALFTIQSAISEALAQEFPLVGTSLSGEAEFVENFRSQFTTLVRQNILANPNFPLEDIRNAIYTAAVDIGLLGNLTLANGTLVQTNLSESSIEVDVWNGATATAFPFGQFTNTNYYGTNSDGTLYETVPGTSTSITFSFNLSENYSSAFTTTLNSVDLGDSALGATISTATSNYTTGATQTGGVILKRKFDLNLGFGINTTAGFFIFNPTEATGLGLKAAPMVDFGFMAELTGNVASTSSITPFFQDTYASALNGLSVEVADGRLIDQLENESSTGANLNGSNNDNLPSGFYGDALFDLNFDHTLADAPASLSFLNGRYADVEDLRATPEIGADATYAAQTGFPTGVNPDTDTPVDPAELPSLAAGSLFNFVINADADVDLTLQSQNHGLVPAIQADLVYDKSYGAGAIGFGLIFNNTAVVGLGNAALGAEEISDQATVANAASTTAQINAALADYSSIATKVSPIWRFLDRDQSDSLLLANTGQGNTFADYQNIELNLVDYLGNTLNGALKLYEEVVAPLQPYINFLNSPIPGTPAFTEGGIVLGVLLGPGFGTFILAIDALNALLEPLAPLAAEDTSGSGWFPALISSTESSSDFPGEQYLLGAIPDKQVESLGLQTQKYNSDLAKQNQKSLENTAETSTSTKTGLTEDTSSSNSAAESAAVEKNVSTSDSDSTSEMFDKNKSGGTTGDKETADSNKSTATTSDGKKLEKPSALGGGLGSNGDILFDALDYNTLSNVLQGINTNLLRIEIPTLSINYTFLKIIPVPAFPPVLITLGVTIQFDVTINFGWDTEGFFMNTVDLKTGAPTPLFDFSATFSVGVGLTFGIAVINLSVFFEVQINFDWNDVSGTGKMHSSDFSYLTSHHDSIFAINITGTVGFNFNISLMIPIPLIGPILIPLFSYTYSIELFNVTFLAVTGEIQLGTVLNSDVLLLNSGLYASQRLFANTSSVNENFTLYDVGGNATAGENILVDFDNQYYEEFDGIKQVIGYLGSGSSEIDAGASLNVGSGLTLNVVGQGSKIYYSNFTPLHYAVEDFYGGTGDTVLIAGAGYNSAWGSSLLQGGTGTGTELLDTNVTMSGVTNPGFDIIAGGGPAIINGTPTGSDIIVAGQGPDLITGATNDDFYFESGFGNDRIYVTGGNNAVSFDGLTIQTLASGTVGLSGKVETVIDPLLTSAQIAQYITPVSVAPITTSLTLSFGQLVESAVTGDSTVFFATDPAEVQQINSWTGGVGGDTYNVYYFAPGQTLTLDAPVESSHVNTFNIYFGNPNIVYYSAPTQNQGTINLGDTNAQDILDIDQTFPETVNSGAGATGYGASYLNGREVLNYDTNLLINYNAPNSTIILGSVADQATLSFDPINAGYYNVGTIVLISPIEFESSNVVIKVKNTLDLLYDVNIVGSAATPASLEIDITNAFPTGESDLTFESGVTLGISAVSESGKAESSAAWDGYGTITLNLNSGSLKDVNEVNNVGGTISVIKGTLIISALTSIGSPNDIFNIVAGNFAARTTGLNDVSGQNGIFVKSPDDLHIIAAGAINGLTTAAGDIYVDVEGGHTLYYYQINAGAGSGAQSLGGNVTLIADSIKPGDAFLYTVDEPTKVPVTIEIVTFVPTFNLFNYELDLFFGGFGFASQEPVFLTYAVQVVDLVVGYQIEEEPQTVPAGGITSTGSLVIGGTTLTPSAVGDYIRLTDQANASQDGTYLLTSLTTGNGGTWALTSSTVANPTISYTANTPIALAATALSGTGALTIGATTLTTANIGDYIKLTAQSAAGQDGTYVLTALSTANGGSWTLTSTTATNPTISFTASSAITVASTGLFGSGSDSITGTGTLSFWNDSNGSNITVATPSSGSPSGLYISSTILSEIAPGFATIKFGRSSTDTTATGEVFVNGYTFNQSPNIIFQGSSINVNGSVSSDYALAGTPNVIPDAQLQFLTYGTGAGPVLNGHLTFASGVTTIAGTINISSIANLTLQGTFLSEDPAAGAGRAVLTDGLIQVESNGTVTIASGTELDATVGQSSIYISGTSVTINAAATVEASDNLTIIATLGIISETSASSPNRLKAANLLLQASQGISLLHTDVLNVVEAATATGNIFLNNDDSDQLTGGAVNVDSITTSIGSGVTSSGTITFTNVGDIDFVRGVNITAPLIQTNTVAGSGVSLTSTSGAITGGTNYNVSEDDIETNSLTLQANGAIGSLVSSTLSDTSKFLGLITQAMALSATSTTGNIIIGNVGAVTLGAISAPLGAISLYDTDAVTFLGAVTAGAGNILVDTHRLATNGGSILLGEASPTPGIDGTVNAGTGTVTLTADNGILGTTGFNLITGSYVTLTAWGDEVTHLASTALISVKLDTPTVDAVTEEPGKIVLDTNNNLLLHNVQTPLGGDIDVTAEGANLVTYDVDAYSSNVNLTATGTITDDTVDLTTLSGTGTLTIGGHSFTSADVGDYVLLNHQTSASQNGVYVVTAVSTTGGGSWTLTASTAANPTISYTAIVPLASALSVTNDIIGATLTTMSVGNTVLKTDVSDLFATVGGTVAGSLTVTQDGGFMVDSASTYGGSITITAGINSNIGIIAAGFINVGTITAGDGLLGDLSPINLTAIGSYIQDPTFGDLVDNSLVTGGTLTATTTTGIHGLNTEIATLDATSGAPGAFFTLDQTGDIVIDSVDMTIGGGTAGGNFTLTTVSGNGTAGQITVNDLTTDTVDSTVTLTSTDSDITQSTGDLTANALVAQAATGITLLTSVLTIQSAITTTGNIVITNDNSAAANSLAGAVAVDLMQAPAGNITFINYGDIDFLQTSPQPPLVSTGTTGMVSFTSTYGGIFGDTIYTAANGAVDIKTGTLALQADGNINNLHGTWIYGLVTEAASISANSTTGSITILNVGAATFTDVETQKKSIALYDTTSLTVAGNVTSNNAGGSAAGTILLDTRTFDQLGGSVNLGVAGAPGTAGDVNSGAATTTIFADDGIFGALGLNLITGSYVTLKAYGDVTAPVDTVPLIDVKLDTPTVDANTYANGQIVLDTNNNILLDDVNSYAGDIIVTAEAAVFGGTGVNLQADVVNAGSAAANAYDVHLTADGTITDSAYTAALNDSSATHNITANHLYAQSVGDSVLKTNINYLTASVGNLLGKTGSLLVNQDKALTVVSAVTTDGTITINAGQVTDLGNIFLGIITAGGTSAIDLNALGGYVTDPTYAPTATGPGAGDTSLVTGGVLTITAPLGVRGIETQVTQFDITSVGPNAYVLIDQQGNVIVDNIDLSATGGDITLISHPFTGFGDGTMTVKDITTDTVSSTINLTSSGAINQELDNSQRQIGKITGATLNADAVTGIDILTDINYLNAAITGLSGNIIVTQDHTLTIGQVQTPSGAFDLTLVAGAIIASVQPLALPYNVEANEIDLILPDAIAAAGQMLDVYADQVDADVTTGGGIYIQNFKDHTGSTYFTADQIDDASGTVVLTTIGNLLARDIEITADLLGNDMVFTTTGGGNVVLNFVGTGLADAMAGVNPPKYGDLDVTSDGMINAVNPATALVTHLGRAINIVAANVNFSAQTGIGSPASLAPEMTASSLTAKTVTGDINIGVDQSTDFTIKGYSTHIGNLGFIMSGGGNLHATGFSTDDGDVHLTVEDKASLFLGTLYDAVGNVFLTMDHVQFVGGPASVYGTGELFIKPDSSTQYVQIDSYFAQTVYEQQNTLEIGNTAFEAFLTRFQSIIIGNPSDNITYVYYYYLDPYTEGNAGGAPLSETTINFTYLEANNAPPGEFQLAELYAALATQAGEGQLTADDIQNIIDELGLEGDFSSDSFDDSDAGGGDDGDDGDDSDLTGSIAIPAGDILTNELPAGATSVATLVPSALHSSTQASPYTEHDDVSWIDRAVVVTAATSLAARPLRRFSRLG
jgi:hypothetical protein